MKRKIMLTIFGMSAALTACSGDAKTTEPAPVEHNSETKIVVAEQSEAESETEKRNSQEAPTETESSEETGVDNESESEKETEFSGEAASDKETNSGEAQETETATASEEQTPQEKGSFTQADIAVSVRGVAVAPGEIMENYINALGDPDALDASPSCVEAGDDKTYTYGGVIIYSFRANATDRINLIEIVGSESLVKGIHIGDTVDAVIAAYGDAYTMDGDEMIYEVNDRVMGFLITDGKVSFMELFAR